jgi:hypothetical protein
MYCFLSQIGSRLPMLFHVRREMGDTPNMTQYKETGSNLSQESTDVCEQDLIVTELYKSFNHNNKQIVLSL